MHRVCFQLRVKQEKLAEYTARHAAVWPEFLAEMESAGWRNYSIFSRGDGVLIGYFETADREAAQAHMLATEIDACWQKEMEDFFDRSHSGAEGFTELVEIFNMENQLAAARAEGLLEH